MTEFLDSNVCVYLVEDDEFYLKVFENKFKTSTKYNIFTFNSGESLIEFFRRKPLPTKYVHIVVLDYYLRSMENQDAKNGVEILKLVKEINLEIEVILYSGIEDDSIVSQGIQIGAVTFVKKNENSFTRIHNSIKGIISKHSLELKHTQSRLTIKIFVAVILACLAGLAILYYTNPDIF